MNRFTAPAKPDGRSLFCVILRIAHDAVQKILLKCPALLRGDGAVGHDDKRQDGAAALKRQLHMCIRLRLQAVALIKPLAAAGQRILRRLDLQKKQLLRVKELLQNFSAGSMAAQLRLDGKMLQIDEAVRFPQEYIGQQPSVLHRAQRLKVRVLQRAQMIVPRAPLVGREARLVQGKRRVEERMSCVDSFKLHF